MAAELLAFVGVAALVIVTPGQDTALTIRNTLLGGRAAGVATALGVAGGQAVWTLAGAAYLVMLGAQTLWAALRGGPAAEIEEQRAPGARAPLRQGS